MKESIAKGWKIRKDNMLEVSLHNQSRLAIAHILNKKIREKGRGDELIKAFTTGTNKEKAEAFRELYKYGGHTTKNWTKKLEDKVERIVNNYFGI